MCFQLLFVDSGEASKLSASSNNTDAISPRRRIETNTRITPGGAIVKMTTTTTTEKPKDHRVEPFFNGKLNTQNQLLLVGNIRLEISFFEWLIHERTDFGAFCISVSLSVQ